MQIDKLDITTKIELNIQSKTEKFNKCPNSNATTLFRELGLF